MLSPNETEIGMTDAQFMPVDYALLCLLLLVSAGIGVWSAWRSRGGQTTLDYLLGNRSMAAVPVGFSLIGGVVSSISLLGYPTDTYLYGTQISLILVGTTVGIIFVAYSLLPVIYKLQIISITQYLEMRFKSRIPRLLSTVCLIIEHTIYAGIFLYAPSLALSTITKLPTWISVVVTGLVCTFYISVGGVKAVVYTDVVQTLLMFIGVLVVVVMCCVHVGSPADIWDIAEKGERIEFFNMDPSPFVRLSFWSTCVLGVFFAVFNLGIRQSSYQRLASIGSLPTAQRICLFFLVGLWIIWSLNYFSGLVAYAVYKDCDPLTSGRIQRSDQIISFLAMQKLRYITGGPGVFVAAVYGSVLSSMSTIANGEASLIWEDLLKDRPYFAQLSSASATKVIKMISVCTGLSSTILAVFVGELGDAAPLISSVTGALLGPMTGMFMAGIYNPWINNKSVVVGFLVALMYNIWMVVGSYLRGGGAPPHLPLSVDGCPENLHFNHSIIFTTSVILDTSTTTIPLVTNDTIDHFDIEGTQSRTIYDVSYCYFGMIGILVTVIISNLVSIIAGTVAPDNVDEKLVNARSARLHCWLWARCCWAAKEGLDIPKTTADSNESCKFNMIPVYSNIQIPV